MLTKFRICSSAELIALGKNTKPVLFLNKRNSVVEWSYDILTVQKDVITQGIGVVNGKFETLRNGEMIVFLCKSDTLIIFKLRRTF